MSPAPAHSAPPAEDPPARTSASGTWGEFLVSLVLHFFCKFITRSESKGQAGHPFGIKSPCWNPEHRSLNHFCFCLHIIVWDPLPPRSLGVWRRGVESQGHVQPGEGGLSHYLCDTGVGPCCSGHHPSCVDTRAISRSSIIALVLEQLLSLSRKHLCRLRMDVPFLFSASAVWGRFMS